MAVAYSEVLQLAKRTKSLREIIERQCPMCQQLGIKSGMHHDKPKRDHWYCATCRHVEIDWPAIYRRVEDEILYEYPMAKAALAARPAAPIARYDAPYVEGGVALSQQELYVTHQERDRWVVMLVEQMFRCGLTMEEKDYIVARYFERWSMRAIAARLHMARSTVEDRRKSALQQFARAAKWV